MDQTDKNTEGQKPKFCKLAIASPLVFFSGYWTGVVLMNQDRISLLISLGTLIFFVSPFAGMVLGITAHRKIHKSNGALKGYIFSIMGIILTACILAQMLVAFLVCPPSSHYNTVICSSNMSGLGKAIQIYACYDGNCRYPTEDKWCDLLIKYAEVTENEFVCRDALKRGDKGRCHYAINPNCGLNSPPDTVLLFETRGGWNQYGGPELLTTEHHKGKVCHIVLNDSHVYLIRKEHLSELKWDNKPKGEPKQ